MLTSRCTPEKDKAYTTVTYVGNTAICAILFTEPNVVHMESQLKCRQNTHNLGDLACVTLKYLVEILDVSILQFSLLQINRQTHRQRSLLINKQNNKETKTK